MSMLRVPVPEPGVFSTEELGSAGEFFEEWGFVVLRGAVAEDDLARLEDECTDAQARLVAGDLPDGHGTVELVDDTVGAGQNTFANYVIRVTELSPAADAVAHHPVARNLLTRWLGDPWLGETGHGVVYQDARSGRDSGYSRIGWHSDWQSAPHLSTWPSVAFTVHIDATSPANGFLRVVPGSHRWATPPPWTNVNNAVVPAGSAPWGGHTDSPPPQAMPLGFEKVPGEIGVYAERGDVIFHDGYLWHSAARATDDAAIRRHLRGSWFGGDRPDEDDGVFVKNAAR